MWRSEGSESISNLLCTQPVKKIHDIHLCLCGASNVIVFWILLIIPFTPVSAKSNAVIDEFPKLHTG